MMPRTLPGLSLPILALLALTACQTEADAPAAPAEDSADMATDLPEDTCGRTEYADLVGQLWDPARAEGREAPLRVLAPGDMATRDYRIERLNVMTDEDGVVQDLTCG